MIAVDTNILVYAHMPQSPFNAAALSALTPVIEGQTQWAIPWPCVHEFLGIVTRPGIYEPVSTIQQAVQFIESLRASPRLTLLSESPGYFDRLVKLITGGRIVGPRVHDARIAALCLHHGVVELWSADRDFTSFPELKVRNPLAK